MIGEFKQDLTVAISVPVDSSRCQRWWRCQPRGKKRAERIPKVSEYLSLQEVNPSLAAGLSVQSQLLSTVVNVVNLDLQKTHLLAFQSEAALQRLLLRIFWKADSCRPSKAEFQQRPKLIIFWPFKKDQKEPLSETSHPSPVESAVSWQPRLWQLGGWVPIHRHEWSASSLTHFSKL